MFLPGMLAVPGTLCTGRSSSADFRGTTAADAGAGGGRAQAQAGVVAVGRAGVRRGSLARARCRRAWRAQLLHNGRSNAMNILRTRTLHVLLLHYIQAHSIAKCYNKRALKLGLRRDERAKGVSHGFFSPWAGAKGNFRCCPSFKIALVLLLR